MDSAIAISNVRLADLPHSLPERGARITCQQLALSGPMLAGQTAGSPLAVTVGLHHIIDNLFHERRPGNLDTSKNGFWGPV